MTSGPKIWLITGISRGFGRELAEALLFAVTWSSGRHATAPPTFQGKGSLDVLNSM